MQHKSYYPLVLLAVLCLFQVFFAKIYLNDKGTVVYNTAQTIEKQHSLLGKGLPCVERDGSTSQKEHWLEEPPVFPVYLWTIQKFVGRSFSYKITGAITTFFLLMALFFLLSRDLKITEPRKKLFLAAMLSFTPILYIHTVRPLPDIAAMALTVFSFLLYRKQHYTLSWLVALVAVTTKPLAIVAFTFFLLGDLVSSFMRDDGERNGRPVVTALRGSLFSLTLIPFLLWLYFIFVNGYDNPFFQGSFNLTAHTGGSDFSMLLVKRFWSRYATFLLTRGIGIIGTLMMFVELVRTFRRRQEMSSLDLSMLVYLIGSPIFWVIVRGQIDEPWYSFYVIPPFIYFSLKCFFRMKPVLQVIALTLTIVTTVTFLEYSLKKSDLIIERPDEIQPFLACHYFD